ncbi:Syd protein [Streptomyces lydicamycinicus]|uniref:Syd protein n=1 Tax=Streptomyces lydicamycinicus TaxID=1546107 RepID=A0A0N7YKK9_9ACTN|nr:Syd protein [Streptomyces lydicamycinicus]
MIVGSILAYELTHSIATNGAIRQSPATTRVGVTTCLRTGDAADWVMTVAPSPGCLLCDRLEIYGRAVARVTSCPHIGIKNPPGRDLRRRPQGADPAAAGQGKAGRSAVRPARVLGQSVGRCSRATNL